MEYIWTTGKRIVFFSDPTWAQDVCMKREMSLSCLLSQAVMWPLCNNIAQVHQAQWRYQWPSATSFTLKDWNNRMPTMDFLNLEGTSAATNACRSIHGIHLNYRETLLIFFFYIWSARNPSQGIHYCATPRQTGSVHRRQGQGPLSPEMKNKTGAHCQCRHLQEGRRPWVH